MPQQNQSFWDLVFNRNQGRSSGSKNSGYAWPAMYQPSFWDRVFYPQGFPGQDPNKARMNKYGYADTGASDEAQAAWARSADNYAMKTAADELFKPSESKPVTKISSAGTIADRLSTALDPLTKGRDPGETGGFPDVDLSLFGGRNPGETGGTPDVDAPQQSGYRPPPFNVPLHPPEMAEPAADTGERNIPPGPLPGGIIPDWSGVGMPQAGTNPTPFGGATYGGNRFGGNRFGGNTFGGNTFGGRTGRDVLQAVKGWNGKVYAEGGPTGYFARGGSLRTHGGPIPTMDDYRNGKGPPRAPDGRTQHFAWAAMIPMAMSALSSLAKSGSGGGGGGGGGMQAPQAPGPVAPPTMAAPTQLKPIDLIPGDEPEKQAYGGRSGFMRGGYPELYNRPVRQGYFSTGGGNNYVQGDGQGDGRSDHIDALLSPGEYVMDAETVSLMGDGDNEAGARKFDKLRKNVRIHKGKQLARGEFSPQAKKNAEEYLARDAISDGFRQHGRG